VSVGQPESGQASRSSLALAWALYADGKVERASELSREALRIDTDKPLFLYHAGLIAAADGREADARRHFTELLERNPRFDPLFAPRAKRALAGLG
jgi:tetratricopeptide (TPR) repeat protein